MLCTLGSSHAWSSSSGVARSPHEGGPSRVPMPRRRRGGRRAEVPPQLPPGAARRNAATWSRTDCSDSESCTGAGIGVPRGRALLPMGVTRPGGRPALLGKMTPFSQRDSVVPDHVRVPRSNAVRLTARISRLERSLPATGPERLHQGAARRDRRRPGPAPGLRGQRQGLRPPPAGRTTARRPLSTATATTRPTASK